MNDPVEVRRHLRATLAMRPRNEFTETQLFEATRRLCPGGELDVAEFRTAVEWNLAHDYITFRMDEDLDKEVWKLTKAGKAKEGVK